MISPALFSSSTDQWPSPRVLAAELVATYRLTLDVCADRFNAVLQRFFTEEQNGLAQDWRGERVYCNPPYGPSEDPCPKGCKKLRCRLRKGHRKVHFHGCAEWVAACANHGASGGLAVMLVPARTDTTWWHRHIWDCRALDGLGDWRPGVRGSFIPGRLKFGNAKSGAPFPSVVVVFGDP